MHTEESLFDLAVLQTYLIISQDNERVIMQGSAWDSDQRTRVFSRTGIHVLIKGHVSKASTTFR